MRGLCCGSNSRGVMEGVEDENSPLIKDYGNLLGVEDLVMIPFKGRDRSIVRIERLNQGNVNYKAAHYVADGPFKGIVINKAASDLRSVGRADLTLSFDVSMTDKKHNVNPEYKERRKVHFWFKPEADNTDLGREYMRQLLKPEGFPRDYVSFIKKALVLTQRFPLIQRIDIVLIPQYLGAPPGGRDGPDGFINGSLRSPTHEDWLKTTDEEQVARMRAQGLGSAPPGSASLDPGQERRNQQAEEERKRREEQERLKKEEEERKRREEEQRKREEERRKREEEQRKRAAEERKRREEAEKRRREEAELMARKRREEQEQRERKKREEAEKRRKEEEELRRRAEEERQWREQQEQAKREAERKRREQEENKWKKRREEERLRREKEEEERLKRLKEEEERQRQLNAQAEEEEDEPIQNFITVMTPAVYDYQYLPEVSVNNKTDVAFRLKASANAHVALSSVYGDTERKTYEIVLGAQGNTKTMIRHGGEGPVMVEKVTRNLLDGDESRPFWISWANGKVVVGEGMEPGEDPFLVWDVPQNRIHSVNCMAVSTAPGSEGQWEFVEYIYPRRPETETRDAKRARFRTSLMWLAKKQKMLQVLEDAYPNSVNTPDLLRWSGIDEQWICNIGLNDMMTAVVILKEFVNRGLITEVVKGVWIRSPSGSPGDAHVIKVVDHLPVLKGRDIPSIAIVTSLYCEKLAVDAMMENKVSYVKYRTEEDGGKSRGESHVYTVGRIGSQMCVSTKLSRVGGSKGATIAAGNTVTRLLGIFDKVDHVIFVGVGGAVPDYHDYSRHVRLADVVVSCPSTKSTQQQHAGNDSGPVYYHCQKFGKGNNGKYEYETRPFEIKDETLQRYIDQLKRSSESGTYARPAPWERFIDEGLAALNAEESNFSKPSLKKDKLYAWVDDQMVQVEHPKPPKGKEYLYKEGQTHARYGPVASGKYLARNEKLRYDFARKHGVMAYDLDLDACLDAVTGSRKDSFIVIRGIADYADGSKSKEWQPYASLVAAAYMKALVTAMPTSYRRSGYYH